MAQIDMFELYKDFMAIVNTSQNGFWRPEKDFERNVNEASLLLWNNKIDEAQRSQRGTDELSPFLVSKNIIVAKQNSFYGTFGKPDDKDKEYGRYASARLVVAGKMCVPCKDVDDGKCCNGTFKSDQELAEDYYDTICEVAIEKVDNQRWPSVLKHLSKRPTLENPKLTQINNQFQVSPRQVSVVVLNYYTQPKYATFKYTLTPGNLENGSGDEIIYDKNASTPLQWQETVKGELLEVLKKVYISYTRDTEAAQIDNIQKRP